MQKQCTFWAVFYKVKYFCKKNKEVWASSRDDCCNFFMTQPSKCELHAAISPQTWQLLSHDDRNLVRTTFTPRCQNNIKPPIRIFLALRTLLVWYSCLFVGKHSRLHVFCCSLTLVSLCCACLTVNQEQRIYFILDMESNRRLGNEPTPHHLWEKLETLFACAWMCVGAETKLF